MRVPYTYAEWSDVLDNLKKKTDDDRVLSLMKQGTIEWQPGVADRFIKQLFEAINYRLNKAADMFRTSISRARGQERIITQAILSMRKELIYLKEAVNLPALPQREREYCTGIIKEQADEFQKMLEEIAKSDRSGKLSSVIRNNKVNLF